MNRVIPCLGVVVVVAFSFAASAGDTPAPKRLLIVVPQAMKFMLFGDPTLRMPVTTTSH